jgi:hypothetical protein
MALMTNTEGFVARVELRTGKEKAPVEGRLLGNGSRFLFVPDMPTRVFTKRKASEQTTYSWDVAQSKGFMINEALQGYAPVSKPERVTGLELKEIGAVYETIDGHRCQKLDATLTTSDGAQTFASVWRATDLKGFPLQIKASNGQILCVFSHVVFERVSLGAFVPPDGFSAYASADAMLSAMLERQNAIRKLRWQDPSLEESNDVTPHENPGMR